jgi:hypothetical protein
MTTENNSVKLAENIVELYQNGVITPFEMIGQISSLYNKEIENETTEKKDLVSLFMLKMIVKGMEAEIEKVF